jgi:prepilin-type processing-associated H-X9-DG protein
MKARAAAQSTACQSNLRQMYAATVLYQNLYKGYLPQHRIWFFGMSQDQGWDHPPLWINALPSQLGIPPLQMFGTYFYNVDPAVTKPYPYPTTIFKCPAAATINEQPNTYAMNDCLMQWIFKSFPAMDHEDMGIKPEFLRSKRMQGPPGRQWNFNNVPYLMDGMFGQDVLGTWRYLDYRSYINCDALTGWGGAPTNDAWLRKSASNPHRRGMNCVFLDGHIEWVGPKDPLMIQPNDPVTDRSVRLVPAHGKYEDIVW